MKGQDGMDLGFLQNEVLHQRAGQRIDRVPVLADDRLGPLHLPREQGTDCGVDAKSRRLHASTRCIDKGSRAP